MRRLTVLGIMINIIKCIPSFNFHSVSMRLNIMTPILQTTREGSVIKWLVQEYRTIQSRIWRWALVYLISVMVWVCVTDLTNWILWNYFINILKSVSWLLICFLWTLHPLPTLNSFPLRASSSKSLWELPNCSDVLIHLSLESIIHTEAFFVKCNAVYSMLVKSTSSGIRLGVKS